MTAGLLICATAGRLFSQPVRLDPVFEAQGRPLAFPLAGGLNNPQLSEADLDGDGLPEIYVFDRTGNRHLAFRNAGGLPAFAPELTETFPLLRNWVLLRDYNGDGAMDIFAFSDAPGIPGILVYSGYFADGRLRFRRYPFGTPGNIIYFPLPGGGRTQLFVSNIDYPAVDDCDCDGDLDIVTFNAGGGYAELYRNLSVEEGHDRDSLIFRLADNCWGGFFESGITPAVDLAGAPGQCATALDGTPPVKLRHIGSTLLTLDQDGDGDRDLVLGDLSFANLTLLHNGGNCEEAWMNRQDIAFPSTTRPADIPFFPVAFQLDLNADGLPDLAASPNSTQEAENHDVVWFYENTGTAQAPRWLFRRSDFLVDEMLDFGTGAFPAFVDYNADGLTDLVVGNGYRFLSPGNRRAQLALFENSGTPQEPRFRLADADWLGLSAFAGETGYFAPAFGDLDGDGDADLLVGEEQGGLFFAENTAGPGRPLRFAPWVYSYGEIDVGQTSMPAVADLNGDGLADLLVGERNGNVNYFQNRGAPGQPPFEPDPSVAPNNFFFGKIDTRNPGSVVGNSAPAVVRTPEEVFLIVGTDEGPLEQYAADPDDLQGAFPLVDAAWNGLREGFQTRPAFADLDHDGLLEVAVGNAAGGIALFRTALPAEATVGVQRPALLALNVAPNPASDRFSVVVRGAAMPAAARLELLSAEGRPVLRREGPEALRDVPVGHLPAGVYLLRVVTEGKLGSARVVVVR